MAAPLPLDPIAEAHRQWTAHGWGEVADGMAAVTSVMRAQQIMMARVEEVLKPFGLTFARYELLTLLHFTRSGALPMAKASARLQVHPTSVTNAVDRLEKAGLVRRTPHPSDRRATLVELTDEGRALAIQATEKLNTEVFARPGIPEEHIDTLLRIIATMRHDAGDFDTGGAPSKW
ncbi:MarR family winged helix-turn-helix transcriptional regulator [Rhodococcus sp. B50]|uniref:MarR family winged helix-turn-helix transcriptional regulator n=1 Tax=Rhodococcus sp. B50 TaxID=2682847 RepID=UPI001BD46551|nr:MarR family transcriptional regulator [Rhodococcus sp. B50]MBS9372972.1 putative HTH-type transcriptional regulator YusO [Rhodococcus sp. B50]